MDNSRPLAPTSPTVTAAPEPPVQAFNNKICVPSVVPKIFPRVISPPSEIIDIGFVPVRVISPVKLISTVDVAFMLAPILTVPPPD